MVVQSALCLSAALTLAAQVPQLKPFQASPQATQTQTLGYCAVKLDYSRPLVKGRTIWGGLVPYGTLWRAGANAATVITFSDPVRIANRPVPAGSYGLFAIPGKERWTWILSRQSGLNGTAGYIQDQDLLRLEAPVRPAPHQEALAYQLDVLSYSKLRVDLCWERVASGFEIEIDAPGIYWTHLEAAVKAAKPGDPVWLQAVNYCLNFDLALDKAAEWLEVSLRAGESERNHYAKARLLRRQGRREEAFQELDRALGFAKAKDAKNYIEAINALKAEWSQPAPR